MLDFTHNNEQNRTEAQLPLGPPNTDPEPAEVIVDPGAGGPDPSGSHPGTPPESPSVSLCGIGGSSPGRKGKCNPQWVRSGKERVVYKWAITGKVKSDT
ncbi:hypothetical protein VFPPC_14143 [Pochonia chlamydosporia 170]|uniref:Uncharacterized protein n=1 Tax=Pochonia chlamydosporia 170 TaxID=1380566 RepID=A0A179FB78_METCM|nr:hypothetical protein VFPPC_14143 [Pochonia chlamydosporia 170]OAQ62359.1 hypothetical protein VFPPC_14143 [Pochonia chlamydosporia 170]